MATLDDSNDKPLEFVEVNEEDEELLEEPEFGDFEDFEENSSTDLADAISQITERVLDTIEGAAAVRDGFFFPNGIDLIEVSVDIAGIKASVKIAGAKSS